MTIREEVSQALGIHIEEDGWSRALKNLDTAGMLTKRRLIDMIIIVLKRLEADENTKQTNIPLQPTK